MITSWTVIHRQFEAVAEHKSWRAREMTVNSSVFFKGRCGVLRCPRPSSGCRNANYDLADWINIKSRCQMLVCTTELGLCNLISIFRSFKTCFLITSSLQVSLRVGFCKLVRILAVTVILFKTFVLIRLVISNNFWSCFRCRCIRRPAIWLFQGFKPVQIATSFSNFNFHFA
jgi:hypothetical protein